MEDMDEKPEDKGFSGFKKGLAALWELIGTEKSNLIKTTVWLIFFQGANIFFALMLKIVFDELFRIYETRHMSFFMVFVVLGMLFLNLLAIYYRRVLQEVRFQESVIELENQFPIRVEKKLLELTLGYHERENTGKKVSKLNRGCGKLIDVINELHMEFLPQLFFLGINVFIILIMDWKLGLIFLLPYPAVVWFNLKIKKKFMPKWEEWEKKSELASGQFCQTVQSVKTVQGYVQEEKEIGSMMEIRHQMKNIDLEIMRESYYKYGFVGMAETICFSLGILLGMHFILEGTSQVGTVVYLITTNRQTFYSLFGVMRRCINISKGLIVIKRMKDLLDEKAEIINSSTAITPAAIEGRIEFQKVGFKYPTREMTVIDGINLSILPGQMVAFVGQTGEGKTTLFKLICRMYDVNEGAITLDGLDIRLLDLFWYRRLFAVVPQEVDIFDASILENVRYSCPEASVEQVNEAMHASYLDVMLEDKEKFPDGIMTEVGERGVKLSGGERKRVAIARAYVAILNGAKFLVLDEATSELDSLTEKAIQDMIGKLRQHHHITIIAIAHRLSTIKHADMIYVIDRGRIIESGNDKSLELKNGLYAKLRELQSLRQFSMED